MTRALARVLVATLYLCIMPPSLGAASCLRLLRCPLQKSVLIGAFACLQEVQLSRKLQYEPTPLFEDNTDVSLSQNTGTSQASQKIFTFISDYIRDGIIKLHQVPTSQQVAEIGTKAFWRLHILRSWSLPDDSDSCATKFNVVEIAASCSSSTATLATPLMYPFPFF